MLLSHDTVLLHFLSLTHRSFVGTAPPTAGELQRVCHGNAVPIWTFLLEHLKSDHTARVIRGNLQLQELRAAQRQRELERQQRNEERAQLLELLRDTEAQARALEDDIAASQYALAESERRVLAAEQALRDREREAAVHRGVERFVAVRTDEERELARRLTQLSDRACALASGAASQTPVADALAANVAAVHSALVSNYNAAATAMTPLNIGQVLHSATRTLTAHESLSPSQLIDSLVALGEQSAAADATTATVSSHVLADIGMGVAAHRCACVVVLTWLLAGFHAGQLLHTLRLEHVARFASATEAFTQQQQQRQELASLLQQQQQQIVTQIADADTRTVVARLLQVSVA